MTEERVREDALRITVFDDVENDGAVCVASALATEIAAEFGARDEKPFSIVARDGDAVIGGLNGATHWGWCYIRQLWVHESWRRHGLGARLLAETQTQARVRDCLGLYVDTFDVGAAAFYERAGFVVFGRIDGFPPGYARMFLQKRLKEGLLF